MFSCPLVVLPFRSFESKTKILLLRFGSLAFYRVLAMVVGLSGSGVRPSGKHSYHSTGNALCFELGSAAAMTESIALAMEGTCRFDACGFHCCATSCASCAEPPSTIAISVSHRPMLILLIYVRL